jgi:hypothetical protein
MKLLHKAAPHSKLSANLGLPPRPPQATSGHSGKSAVNFEKFP